MDLSINKDIFCFWGGDLPGGSAVTVVPVLCVEDGSRHILGHIKHVSPDDPTVRNWPVTAHENEHWTTKDKVVVVGEIFHLPLRIIGVIEMVQFGGELSIKDKPWLGSWRWLRLAL